MSQTKVQLINDVSGNSGFGTSSPAEKLVVNGAIVASGAVSDPSSYTDTGLYIQNKGSSVFDLAAWRSGASVSELTFSTDSGSDAAPVERMRIDKDGKVGIGDPNPDALLHVGTGTNTDGTDVEIHIGGNGTNTRKSMIKKLIQNDDRALQIHAATGSSDEDIRFFRDGSTESMRISSNGDIGAPNGDNIFDASDERLKENMLELTDGLNKINKLKPISYNYKVGWNKNTEGKTKYGFGAQTTEKVDKLLVESFSDKDAILNGETINNPLRVNEKFIIPLLVKAIQELTAKVEALEAA